MANMEMLITMSLMGLLIVSVVIYSAINERGDKDDR